ncbi:MAG TPA: hypothetical protein VFY71_10390 [Planctomycetota bacterium]|nr:hypothetical protein [Planctomycetota bacterium]
MIEVESARPSRRGGLWLAGWLALGLGLRLAAALGLRSSSAEWEADGFVRAWEGWTWGAWSRVRPPGWDWLLSLLGSACGRGDLLALRCASVGLSLASLGCAWLLVRALARRLGAPREAAQRGCTWLTAAWALGPTLVAGAARPLPETVLGGVACLVLAVVASEQPSAWLPRFVLLGAALTLFVLLGGLVAALATVAGLLVFLVPLPRLPVALGAVGAVGLALAIGWRVQRGPDAGRRWEPDAAPAYGLAALLDADVQPTGSTPIDPDVRLAQVRTIALDQMREAGPAGVATALGRRLLVDQSGPERLVDVTALAWPAALLDALLRGAALLLALLTLARLPRTPGAGATRAGLAAGLAAWLVLALAGAASPLALAPFDLVLAAVAAAGLAARPPALRPRWPWIVAAAGALAVLVALAGTRPASDWSRHLGHGSRQGGMLVGLLKDKGPTDTLAHLETLALLSDSGAPFLRLPEAALRHGEAAVQGAPDDQEVLLALARADVENLDFASARAVLSSLVDSEGQPLPKAAVALGTLQELERRVRADRLP